MNDHSWWSARNENAVIFSLLRLAVKILISSKFLSASLAMTKTPGL